MDKKKKETLKDWCKKWSVKQLINFVFQNGMIWNGQYTGEQKKKELENDTAIIASEIRRRILNK